MTLVRTSTLFAVAATLAACATQGGSEMTGHTKMPAASGALVETTPSRDYALNTCIVSGQPLGARPVAYMWNGREVQFCCAGCSAMFAKAPETYLSKLDAQK